MTSAQVFLDVEMLAMRWLVSKDWVYKNYRRIGVGYLNIGGHVRFPLREVESWESLNIDNP